MVNKIYRIGSTDLKVYELTKNTIKESKKTFPEAIHVAELFQAHNNLKLITDEKDPMFLTGSFNGEKPIGKRINILPNAEKLDKAYSLFAPKLTIHDESSNSHWDVMFQLPSGKMTYIYTLEKENLSRTQKFKKVEEFEKLLPKLKKNLIKNFDKDEIALPMMILLKTKMRVGNEIYYKKNSHKGLTTLKKQDIKISKDKITFNYIAKDGVPRTITEIFPDFIIKKLSKKLKHLKSDDFVFTSKSGHPIKDTEFEKAFKKYCGQKFYPHIIRSHFATEETIKFLKENPAPTKEEVKKIYNKIANALGHKKFSKTKGWQDSYQVTLHHYINPILVEKIAKLTK